MIVSNHFTRVRRLITTAFRERLLHGRKELYQHVLLLASGGRKPPDTADGALGGLTPPARPGVWLEMGGGTGANLEYLGPALADMAKAYVVDLSPSLLKIAQSRIERHGWNNVTLLNEDATTLELPQPVDVLTFSYSLTMIPNWYLALENAVKLLRPGGLIAVVDFYVARKHPLDGFRRHSAWTHASGRPGSAWTTSFPAPITFPGCISTSSRSWSRNAPPGSSFCRSPRRPYYLFIGRKPPLAA